jgi:hypothetical protein
MGSLAAECASQWQRALPRRGSTLSTPIFSFFPFFPRGPLSVILPPFELAAFPSAANSDVSPSIFLFQKSDAIEDPSPFHVRPVRDAKESLSKHRSSSPEASLTQRPRPAMRDRERDPIDVDTIPFEVPHTRFQTLFLIPSQSTCSCFTSTNRGRPSLSSAST